MHLIFCIDDRDGLSFCGRRLSQDKILNQHMLRITTGHKLWMSPYSGKLFPGEDICVDEDFQHKADLGDYCFLETSPLLEAYENLESLILYHWNRSYPSTQKFPRSLLKNMHLESIEEFPGSSHEKITMERYVL